ncbi:MAG: hypothetical protein KGJ13_05485, partial [Patescibacteria group bacterium]|nr:hypothetical protein [Patescibacteria group bacterium]
KATITNERRGTRVGFLFIFQDHPVTIDGVVMNGLGVLVLPDLSGYFVLELVPQDAGSASWYTTVTGTYTGKFDRNNALLFTNDQGSPPAIYGATLSQIPKLPPIANINRLRIHEGLLK